MGMNESIARIIDICNELGVCFAIHDNELHLQKCKNRYVLNQIITSNVIRNSVVTFDNYIYEFAKRFENEFRKLHQEES